MSKEKYSIFGTDGIRAKAFEYPLVDRVLSRLGGIFKRITPASAGRLVLFARDTRVSGPAILKSLKTGFERNGYEAVDLGILPTPSLGFLVPQWGAVLGCMISASHNPAEFNGVKFFGPHGGKIPREWELKAEKMLSQKAYSEKSASSKSRKDWKDAAHQGYLDFLRCTVPVDMDLRGMRIVLDCAEGSVGYVLPELLRSLGAEVIALSCSGRGAHINDGCGALHPEKMAAVVKAKRCDIGFAVDGDGDRLMVADEKGDVLNGEWVMASVALDRRARGELGSDTFTTTIVSNFALKKFLESKGMAVHETPVGDRWVLEDLLKHGLGFGGENSGHFIWTHLLPSADASLGALQILEMLKRSGKKASQAFIRFPLYPQAGKQVPAPASKPNLEGLKHFQKAVAAAQTDLDGRGRILVRYSGTEPVLRILLEARCSDAQLKRLCAMLEAAYLKEVR